MVEEEASTTTTESAIPTIHIPTPEYIAGHTAHVPTPVPTVNHHPTTKKPTQPYKILWVAVPLYAIGLYPIYG